LCVTHDGGGGCGDDGDDGYGGCGGDDGYGGGDYNG